MLRKSAFSLWYVLCYWCWYGGNTRGNVACVTSIQLFRAGFTLYIMQSSVEDLGHHDWNVTISFLNFHFFQIPLPGSSIITSGDPFITRFAFGIYLNCHPCIFRVKQYSSPLVLDTCFPVLQPRPCGGFHSCHILM